MTEYELAIGYDDIVDAAHRLRGVVHRTPVLTSRQANQATNAQIFFKCENFQRSGAFKFRGVYNALSCLGKSQKTAGVIGVSAGNHAPALACAAKILQIPATILIPSHVSARKVAIVRQYGADVVIFDHFQADRDAIVDRLVRERGMTVISSFHHPDVIAGHGTAAKELFDEIGPLDYLFVPLVRGGGLMSGSAISASYLSTDCQVIGVEPASQSDIWKKHRLERSELLPISDILAPRKKIPAEKALTVPIIKAYMQEAMQADDMKLRRQGRFFAECMKIVVEPTGCLAAAGALSRTFEPGARVGVIVSGGNIDLANIPENLNDSEENSNIACFSTAKQRASESFSL